MEYQVKTENYAGPMDLLLFFIQRDKLNIYDIPIAQITKEFLDYMKMMEMMNIDLGGEFVYMASLLMRIKAKMLLPVSDADVDLVEDPRTPLVQRVLEYQQYREMSEQLQEKYSEHAVHYPRGQEMAYKDLEIEDDTSKCGIRVKPGGLSNEYINSIKAESRIKFVNVGWLVNQKRLTTMKSRFAASDILLDDEIDK